MKRSPQQRAPLRCCASCEWVFKWKKQPTDGEVAEGFTDCPMCGFASYGARFVHGDKCYRYHRTQEPWMKRKIERLSFRLDDIVRKRSNWKPTESEQLKLDARARRAHLAFYEESMGRP